MKITVKAHNRRLRSGKRINIRKYQRKSRFQLASDRNELPKNPTWEEYSKWLLLYTKPVGHPRYNARFDSPNRKGFAAYKDAVNFYNGWSFPKRLYRGLYIQNFPHNFTRIDFNNMGHFWSYKLTEAIPSWNVAGPSFPTKNIFILEVKAQKDDIHWNDTLDVWYERLKTVEVHLKKGKTMKNINLFFREKRRIKLIKTVPIGKI